LLLAADAAPGYELEHIKPEPVEPPTAEEIEDAIDKGITFLVNSQNDDGSWGNAHSKGLNIAAPVPGAFKTFKAACTALAVSTLIESGKDTPEVEDAISRADEWLLVHLPKLRRVEPGNLYNVWAHAYGIMAMVDLRERYPDDEERLERNRKAIEWQIEMLGRCESVDGGWGYYDWRGRGQQSGCYGTSFVTGQILTALKEAEEAGISPPERLVNRAVAVLQMLRKPDFSYMYGGHDLPYYGMKYGNRAKGSLGRTQACNMALRVWGDEAVTEDVLEICLDRLFAQNIWLDIARKEVLPHESYYRVAGYYYYFGHFNAALCIEQLAPEKRPRVQGHLAAILIPKQEKDGSWWDYPLFGYHQAYGTSLAVMSLVRCRPEETGESGRERPTEQD
jgi:hypothetical protein